MHQQQKWGSMWFLGGDLNEIKEVSEKKGGKQRTEASFKMFKQYIRGIRMVEVPYTGSNWTWANNRKGEGLIGSLVSLSGHYSI